MKTIDIRRSVHKFIDKPVEGERIIKLLRAGMQAPSAGNQQPWEFVVVSEKERKENSNSNIQQIKKRLTNLVNRFVAP